MHQDFKLKNILIESCYSFSIKLADFDVVNDKSDLRTFCDTHTYVMSEIYFGEVYMFSVNL